MIVFQNIPNETGQATGREAHAAVLGVIPPCRLLTRL